jgi:hypothetical protein
MPSDIRNVRLEREGYWSAELHSPVGKIRVHDKFGSWMTGGEHRSETMHEVLPHVAAQLGEEVRRVEREMGFERARLDRAEAAKGRVRARLTGASRRASRAPNGSRVPSRLS